MNLTGYSDYYLSQRRKYNTAWKRAKRMTRECPENWLEVFNRERAVEGLPPVGEAPRGKPKKVAA